MFKALQTFCNNNNNYFYNTHILSSWFFTVCTFKKKGKIICIEHEINYIIHEEEEKGQIYKIKQCLI